jgi:hypothetical protein
MTTDTLTLTDFLLARIAQDERAARKLAETDRRPALSLATTINHPERLLAECAAKRAIVERAALANEGNDRLCLGDTVLTELAAIYADHDDYRDEWKP